MQYIVYLILAPIAAIICGTVFFRIEHSARISGDARSSAAALRWYLAVISGFLIVDILEVLLPTPGATLFMAQLDYLFITLTPVTWFAFVLAYSGHQRWLNRSRFWVFLISPLITNLLVWTNSRHGLIWQGYTFKPVGPFLAVSIGGYGQWFWVHTVYSYALFIAGAALVVFSYFRSHSLYRRQSAWVLAGALIPLVVNLVYIFRMLPGLQKDISPVAFAMAGLAFSVGISRYRLLDLKPIARAMLVEELRDGVIVLDRDERIVDLNPAARKVLHLSDETNLGQQAGDLLLFWNKNSKDTNSAPLEIVLGDEGHERNFELRVSPLSGDSGWLVLMRDITANKQAEEALLRAHQEMEQRIQERTAELKALTVTLEQRVNSRTRDLAALYAVSSVASEVHDMDSLLSLSLARTVASLNSDAGEIYLIDETRGSTGSGSLRLAALENNSSLDLDRIQTRVKLPDLLDWVIENNEPRLAPVNKVNNDEQHTQSVSASAGQYALLMVPMRVEGETSGVLVLYRLKEPLFNVEEVSLVSTIADQVAVAMSGYRLRQIAQQAQVLAQRQKLSADLHDSLTQSLYGLVAFSEAGRAQLERNDLAAVKKTMERINAETRQALKEMRLFLHELRPSVLEEEGLIGALHQRLAAVEGRSDVEARLLADERIHLPLAVEEVLFRIAQEALNNTLRHARAAHVTVYLGLEGENVMLEIRDDGCGFDPQTVGAGRMGLVNMRTRAASIGGDFKLSSSPGQGTRIKVTVPLPTDKLG